MDVRSALHRSVFAGNERSEIETPQDLSLEDRVQIGGATFARDDAMPEITAASYRGRREANQIGGFKPQQGNRYVQGLSQIRAHPWRNDPWPPKGTSFIRDSSPPELRLSRLRLLTQMANPDQVHDWQAGLYAADSPNLDPGNTGPKLSPTDAYDRLCKRQIVIYHPPDGKWQPLTSLEDLHVGPWQNGSHD